MLKKLTRIFRKDFTSDPDALAKLDEIRARIANGEREVNFDIHHEGESYVVWLDVKGKRVPFLQRVRNGKFEVEIWDRKKEHGIELEKILKD